MNIENVTEDTKATVNTKIQKLGKCEFDNPSNYQVYTNDSSVVIQQTVYHSAEEMADILKHEPVYFEQAGPREKIFFDPKKVTAGIVTCGGLAPGINDVIRSIVMELHYRYKVPNILGFRYGYLGLTPQSQHPPMQLTADLVANIMQEPGTFLGSSRGSQDVEVMVDTLVNLNVDMLFTIGGDGTQKGAHAIAEEIKNRKLNIAVVGIPKTIDNDINLIRKTFGFSTAFAKAVEAISSAHSEARGALNGIGMVKLMGRHSGFITVNAALASQNVNFVLIPEKDFDLHGKGGFLEVLKKRVKERGHAVILLAEGAGQKFFTDYDKADASGNAKLGNIGLFMKEEINRYFKLEGMKITLKYIDPSYMIRSLVANPEDAVFCGHLGQMAVHAAMSGRTDMLVGNWSDTFTHVPISSAVEKRKVLDTSVSSLWRAVLASTGQPDSMTIERNT